MTSAIQRFRADAEQHWETFTKKHPTAAGLVLLGGGFALGAAAAVAAPAFLALSRQSIGLTQRNPFGLPPEQLALQFETPQWSTLEIEDMTFDHEFPSSYSDIFARAIRESPTLSSFPKMGNANLNTLAPNTDYVHSFDPREYSHSMATVFSIKNLPDCLRFHPNDFAITGLCSGSQVPKDPRMIRFTSAEAGSFTQSTTTHHDLPIQNVDSKRTEYGFSMKKLVELHRVPITSAYFEGKAFDNITLSEAPGFPFPDWTELDPEHPFTLLFAHPGNITKSTEYGLSLEAFNNGTSVGKMTVKPNVQLPSDPKKPSLSGSYSEWTPKRGYKYAKRKYLRFQHWTVAEGRKLVYLRVHITPKAEDDNIRWIKVEETREPSWSDPEGVTKLSGTPPNKGPASANICVYGVDSAGVESNPECFEANPRRGPQKGKKAWEAIGYAVAGVAGSCLLCAVYWNLRKKFSRPSSQNDNDSTVTASLISEMEENT